MTVLLVVVIFTIAAGCVPGSDSGSGRSVKFQQYFVEGQSLYEQHCSNCHQSDGGGLGRVYPPLNQADYLEQNFPYLACLIKQGKKGEIWVNGVMYNQEMKGIPTLTNLEVAEILTYITNAWGNSGELVEVSEVDNLLLTCTEPK